MEQKKKSRAQHILDAAILLLPAASGLLAMAEYRYLPDVRANPNSVIYSIVLLCLIGLYLGALILGSVCAAGLRRPRLLRALRYRAPLYSVLFLLLALYDFLTLKSGRLLYPFFPWANDIFNIMVTDWAALLESALYTLRLLFCGYSCGAVLGLITGIACGYSDKFRYWVDPLLKILGPIPTSTWIPLVMVVASTLFRGSVFIIALGVWFSVTMASMTGISNVDISYFEAARTLGANERQLVFRVAIPHAVPSIIQGLVQGMSNACTSLMIAEMIGVEAGLGWYIIWSKSWAQYNKMYAAIIIICLIFTGVTRLLNRIKRRVLRWQAGMVK